LSLKEKKDWSELDLVKCFQLTLVWHIEEPQFKIPNFRLWWNLYVMIIKFYQVKKQTKEFDLFCLNRSSMLRNDDPFFAPNKKSDLCSQPFFYL